METKIYLDRLRNGDSQEINEQCSALDLEIGDRELRFPTPISFQISAYTTDDHLILKLSLQATLELPCKICNEWTATPIQLTDFTHAIPTSEIRSRVYDITPFLQENLALEIPQFTECNGDCPERASLTTYLK